MDKIIQRKCAKWKKKKQRKMTEFSDNPNSSGSHILTQIEKFFFSFIFQFFSDTKGYRLILEYTFKYLCTVYSAGDLMFVFVKYCELQLFLEERCVWHMCITQSFLRKRKGPLITGLISPTVSCGENKSHNFPLLTLKLMLKVKEIFWSLCMYFQSVLWLEAV